MQEDKLNPPERGSVDREAKVDALRRAIAAGTYNIPSGKVADKIVEDMLRKS